MIIVVLVVACLIFVDLAGLVRVLLSLIVPVICVWFPQAAGFLVNRLHRLEPAADAWIRLSGWICLVLWAFFTLRLLISSGV
ncbi:MAG: hypothetical protein JSV80_07900, partial [Acidobacteriota bacterium]